MPSPQAPSAALLPAACCDLLHPPPGLFTHLSALLTPVCLLEYTVLVTATGPLSPDLLPPARRLYRVARLPPLSYTSTPVPPQKDTFL